MHPDHRVPIIVAQVHEHAVAQDPGVVHQRVQAAELGERGVDHLRRALGGRHVVTVGHGPATLRADLVDNLLRGSA